VRCGQGWCVTGVLVIFGENERVDELQRDEGSPRVWSETSIDSRGGGEVRLEELPASVIFGRGPSTCFAAKLKKRRVSACASEGGEEDRRNRRGSGSPTASDSTGYGSKTAELRRAIAAVWRCLVSRKERAVRGDHGGFYRRLSLGGGGRV
jgi:hypothetical protein